MADSFLLRAWYGKSWWLWLLRPLELLFRGVISLRRLGFRLGLFARYRAPVPVVVVGNITVGGTGKTPVVIALLEALQAEGLRPAVVSRGYGGNAPHYPFRVSEDSTPQQSGDEPLLIQLRTGCPVVVDPDRASALRSVLQEEGIDVVIADDGLQHYAVERDLEIVLVDAGRGLGNGWCLPAGPLREPVSRLQAVDWVLYRGGDKPANSVSYRPRCFRRLCDGELRPMDSPGFGPAVHAVAGIGQPEQFFRSLEVLGFRPCAHPFPDHHGFSSADFAGLQDRPIIMTEKDAVKCADVAGPDAWCLVVDAVLPAALVDAVKVLARPPHTRVAQH